MNPDSVEKKDCTTGITTGSESGEQQVCLPDRTKEPSPESEPCDNPVQEKRGRGRPRIYKSEEQKKKEQKKYYEDHKAERKKYYEDHKEERRTKGIKTDAYKKMTPEQKNAAYNSQRRRLHFLIHKTNEGFVPRAFNPNRKKYDRY